MKKLLNTRAIFALLFALLSFYYLVVKAELYESKTVVMVRDLGSSASASGLGFSLLGVGSSSKQQDSMVVQEYLLSLDMFTLLDDEFHLMRHYQSDKLDIFERVSFDTTTENMLEFYRKRVIIYYDEISTLLHISFVHTQPKKAQEIVKFMVKSVERELNEFNRKKAKKQLSFIELQHDKTKQKMQNSSKVLEEYQNSHLLLDPMTTAKSSSTIIANLEASLTQKRIEYKTKSSYLNKNNYEIMALKTEIKEMQRSLVDAKKELTGNGKNRLNKILFEYEKLKMQAEFDVEIYKNNLIELETTKLTVSKQAKTLSVVSKPNLPDGYAYPNKPKALITIAIVMLLIYGIFSMLLAIIRDHKE